MERLATRSVLIALAFLTITANLSYAEEVPAAITRQQVIQIAEKFVVEQGYTSVPTNISKDLIAYETIEWQEDVLGGRKATLDNKALGTFRDEFDRWYVAFLYVGADPTTAKTARVVQLDQTGKPVRVEHSDLDLQYLRGPEGFKSEWQENL